MGKWIIPRHKPRKASDDIMSDINHGKKYKRKHFDRIKREKKRKQDEYSTYVELAKDGIEVARLVLGSCNRKRSLPLDIAKRCALSANIESGKRMLVYFCPYCGLYHITSHPEESSNYVFDTGRR